MSEALVQEIDLGPSYVRDCPNGAMIVESGTDTLGSNLRMPLLLLTDDEADTFVFIDAGPQQQDGPGHHHWGIRPTAGEGPIPHRIHSRKLLDTGSDVLKNLFRPRIQARVRKRYGLTRDMPPGVKYAIDLTPPSEGDEAVIFMTELSCPIGVRTWASLQTRWRLPSTCVGGQDERDWITAPQPAVPEPLVVKGDNLSRLYKTKKNKAMSSEEKKPRRATRIMNWQGNLPTLRPDLDLPPSYSDSEEAESEETKQEDLELRKESEDPHKTKQIPGLPLDYSPSRHRTCLERVLHAIEGLDPKLDTAPKLWTYFALAKLLKVVTYPAVGDRILVWLYAGANTLFIEVNPELSYQIGCGLQNRNLCQDSFAILVGEEALLALESTVNGTVPKRKSLTMHGRARETLDDAEVQRVEYASKVFLDRILNEFVELAGNEMQWVESIAMSNIKNCSLDIAAHKPLVEKLVDFSKKYVRGQIYQHLLQHCGPVTDARFYSNDTVNYPGIDYYTASNAMPLFCQILTRTFWKSLGDTPQLIDLSEWHHTSLKDLAPNVPKLQNQDNAIIRKMSKADVDRALSDFLLAINGTDVRTFRDGSSNVYFDFTCFRSDVKQYLMALGSRIAGPLENEQGPDATYIHAFGVQYEIVDTLLCLGEDEFKFLPLWAGGNDDGTGGVFDDQNVPFLEEGGFSTAGPSVHRTGDRDMEDSSSLSSFESIRPDDAASTVQRASHQATASHATTTIVSARSSTSEFELVAPIQNMGIRSTSSSVIADDVDTVMSDAAGNEDEQSDDGIEFYDDDDDDDDDDNDYDDDNDTIGTTSDREE